MKQILGSLVLVSSAWGSLGAVHASPIDLNDFFADPTVTVAADGSSALFAEDPNLPSAVLSNDPGLGDPNVIIPGPGVVLEFDYVFTEASGEDDEFGAFVIDAGTGISAGMPYEFFAGATSSGSIEFHISGLVGKTLGLQFELASFDNAYQSTLTVSNVRLTTSAPEPATFLLLLAGGAVLAGRRRCRGRPTAC